jgi:BMFP domain-containing protein YqiC
MQTDNRLLDDLAKVASGALGTLQGVKGEVTARLRDQFERVLANLDLVTREEFDAVKAMAAAARGENEAMAARLEALEAQLPGTRQKRAASASAKAAPTAAKVAKTPKTKPASAKAKPAKAKAGSGAKARRPKA